MVGPASIIERMVAPSQGGLSKELAHYILSLDFPAADIDRYDRLSEKASAGTLSGAERAELEHLLAVNDFLSVIQAKARASLAAPTSSTAA